MQEIRSSNHPVVTEICDTKKPQAPHHHSLKLGLKLNYLNIAFAVLIGFHEHLPEAVFVPLN